ncbi:hypothetical protein J2S25_002516 [Mesobacillus stamsii]|uniref:Uncharacterized protein n=1 Tax=Mesobacillus stamsii TaxID=225347 RepID=A0ABU0FY86_9BACI|nr:hypothetical protein [Mesobacillus stamsii]
MSRIGALKNQKKGKQVANEPYLRTKNQKKGKEVTNEPYWRTQKPE